MDSMQQQLRTFVIDNFLYGDVTVPFTDDDNLIESAIIDSTGIVELVSFVETQYGISVDDVEISSTNFDSINRISAFILQKLGSESC